MTIILQSGCVAIPPLVSVNSKDSSDGLRSRVDDLEKRVKQLEEGSARKTNF